MSQPEPMLKPVPISIPQDLLLQWIMIGARYTTPLTGANDILVAKQICEKLVVCDIDGVLATPNDDENYREGRAKKFCQWANDMLDKIASGDLLLKDATDGITIAEYVPFTDTNTSCSEDCINEYEC